MKKIYLSILSVFACLVAWSQAEGWYKYPVFHDDVTDIVETSDKVYYLSEGSLFSYSPADEESYYYSQFNKLSGVDIASMHYNYDKKYLMLVYDDCNIDLLFDNGKVVNLPDVRDAQISVTKTINDVAFGSDRIVVSTSFGIVVFDDERMEVKESGIYNLNVQCSFIMDDNLYINYRTPDGSRFINVSPLNGRHNNLEKFIQLTPGNNCQQILPLNDDKILLKEPQTGKLSVRRINLKDYTNSPIKKTEYLSTMPIRKYADGYYTLIDEGLLLIDMDGNMTINELPEALKGQKLTFYNDANKLWAGDSRGVARYDVAGDKVTVLNDKMLYADAITCGRVGYMRWSHDGERLYISNLELSLYRSIARGECYDAYQTTNIIENGYPRDASLKVASADHVKSKQHQASNGNTRMYGDAAWMVEDPDNPDIYYCANNHEGLYVLRYNPSTGDYDEIGKFNVDNSPVIDNWGARVQYVDIDPQGNLWMGYEKGNLFSILPAAKRGLDPATITKSDWMEHTKLGNFEISQKDLTSLICRKSNMVFIFSGKYESGLLAVDTKGTYANPNDDVVHLWTSFVDQDGNRYPAPTRITFAIEDNRGAVWVGSNAGIFEITNPSQASDPQMTIRRIKVPRNDGTNFADYLLESDMINWICLDPSGRKWIATENSGIFLVSERGDAIIRNYNIDNSPLPSNSVASIECDKTSNLVYVGTESGLYTFLSDSSAPKDDYSEILAYPNPVRPEFTGDVKITGLMDNTIVKIVDTAGNVVHQTRSEGGMATWNACNYAGDRVKSGVYYVYVSSNNGKSSGAVTKIMVIN